MPPEEEVVYLPDPVCLERRLTLPASPMVSCQWMFLCVGTPIALWWKWKKRRSIVNWKTAIMGIGLSGLMAGTAVAQGPPMNTETAFVVGLDGAAFRTFVQTVRKSKLLQDGSRISDPLDREVQVVATPLMFPHELISNRLVVGAGIPYLDKEMRLTRDGVKQSLSDRGFGDLTLFAKYQLLQLDAPKKTTRVTFKGLLKLPTGIYMFSVDRIGQHAIQQVGSMVKIVDRFEQRHDIQDGTIHQTHKPQDFQYVTYTVGHADDVAAERMPIVFARLFDDAENSEKLVCCVADIFLAGVVRARAFYRPA